MSKFQMSDHSGIPTSAPEWSCPEYADLYCKDKGKQKDAIRRFLREKVRNDWEFPPTGCSAPKSQQLATDDAQEEVAADTDDDDTSDSGLDTDTSDVESLYSVVSEDNANYRPRMDWSSEIEELREEGRLSSASRRSDAAEKLASHKRLLSIRAKIRRATRSEMQWNEGLACFEARREAWTGAKTVRLRSKPCTSPTASPRSPRRFFFRRSMSGSPPNPLPIAALQQMETGSDTSSLAKDDKELSKTISYGDASPTPVDPKLLPVETLLPLAPPILPPENALRASITPSVYLSLYDKIILHNMQPACPINLTDMMQTCIAGWKRDGEWPPKGTAAEPSLAVRKPKKADSPEKNSSRRLSFGIRTKDKDDDARTKGFRKSLQRAFGIGNPQPIASGN